MDHRSASEEKPGAESAPVILVVEDSDADYESTVRAARQAGIDATIVRCSNGDEALEMLFGRRDEKSPQHPLPTIIILDLNLPGTSGDEVLKAVKSDDRLRTIIVTVLSSSANLDDIHRSYSYGANCYVVKPSGFRAFKTIIGQMLQFWLSIPRLPPLAGEPATA